MHLNLRSLLFSSSRDYKKFLSYLADAFETYGAILHAFVILTNHYHLIVETPKGNRRDWLVFRWDQLRIYSEDWDQAQREDAGKKETGRGDDEG